MTDNREQATTDRDLWLSHVAGQIAAAVDAAGDRVSSGERRGAMELAAETLCGREWSWVVYESIDEDRPRFMILNYLGGPRKWPQPLTQTGGNNDE